MVLQNMKLIRPSLVLNRATTGSATMVVSAIIVQLPVPVRGTIEEMDGCDHASDCVNDYWRMIWILITIATIIYFILLSWTCWIKSKISIIIKE